MEARRRDVTKDLDEYSDVSTTTTTMDGTDQTKSSEGVQPGAEEFDSLCVMEVSSEAKPATVEWLLSKIQAQRQNGGANLLARTELNRRNEEYIIHISGSTERLLMAAELMEIKKPYQDGLLREFAVKDIENFQNHEDVDNFLTMSEKQMVILHELENVRAQLNDTHIPGFPKTKIFPGESILRRCLNDDVIDKFFPLHNKPELKKLGQEWYGSTRWQQPLHGIRKYFGDTVAMYFAFLGFYTVALIPPALIGLFYFFTAWENVNKHVFFAIFNLIWTTIFIEAWKRYSATLAYYWGSLSIVEDEETRAAYYGPMGLNKVTGRSEPQYPKWKRIVKYYCVSLPIIMVCLWVAFTVMLGYFWLQAHADAYYKSTESYGAMAVTFLPSMLYAILIGVMNGAYRWLAKELNDWENHRLQSAYDNHLIVKLVLFDFVNCFMSLFYVAFYMRDMQLLQRHLAALLITQQVIGQVREALVPYLFFKQRKHHIQEKYKGQAIIEELSVNEGEKGPQLSQGKREQAEIQSAMDVYQGTLDDYLEMFLQFGYVFLFSSVFPLAAFWALLNNITEVKTDAFKMCRTFQRPFAQATSGIGAWQIAFELMSVIAVITNCALIGLSEEVRAHLPDIGDANMVLIFVAAEHVILVIKFSLAFLIPDVPEWVEVALKRVNYESKQAWRNERITQAKKWHKKTAATKNAASPEHVE